MLIPGLQNAHTEHLPLLFLYFSTIYIKLNLIVLMLMTTHELKQNNRNRHPKTEAVLLFGVPVDLLLQEQGLLLLFLSLCPHGFFLLLILTAQAIHEPLFPQGFFLFGQRRFLCYSPYLGQEKTTEPQISHTTM